MYGYTDVSNIFKIKTLYTAFSKSYNSDYYTVGETHNFHEIVIVTAGEIGVTAGSDVFTLKKGSAVIHESMEFHRLWSEGNSCPSIIIFTFAAENMPKLTSKIFEIADLSEPVKILEALQKSFLINDIHVEAVRDGLKTEYQLAVKALELFLLRIFTQSLSVVIPVRTQAARNYASVVTILENNIDKSLSVSEIARMCNMGVANLKKIFTHYSGIGIIQYFNHLKITAAITMLKNGLSVQETANALGFSNQNYFSTAFKRITGKPPSEYKNTRLKP